MRDFLVAGNWKMNGSIAANAELASGIVEGVPQGGDFASWYARRFLIWRWLATGCKAAMWRSARRMSLTGRVGAFTGETAPSMLKDVGCEFVIVGHSERRALYGETDDAVAAKFMATQSAGMIPILCVGETLEEREAGTTAEVIDRQFDAVVDMAGVSAFAGRCHCL